MVSVIRERNPRVLKFVLTLLILGRLIPGDGSLSTKSITDPPTVSDSSVMKITKEIRQMINTLGLPSLDLQEWRSPHASTKSGPNGQAIASFLKDLSILPEELVKAITTLGGSTLKEMIDSLRPYSKILYPDFQGSLRRISVIRDKELKNRPICIFDYWSQSALLPLHNSLMELLRKLKTDATFNQDAKLVPSPLGDSFYYSLDLSSATDRFPVLLQEGVLAEMIGEEKAGAWKVIMTNYPAHSQEGSVLYRTGQPMGAYSSWATFTLCHHLVVQLSAKRSGLSG